MILHQLAEASLKRVEIMKQEVPPEEMKQLALSNLSNSSYPFEQALRKDSLSFICEVKKASPSKGEIVKQFNYLQIAIDYEGAGADCISVLTEPTRFEGSARYLAEIAKKVTIPLLRKDFVVDEYMIYQAKVLGAQAVLLICTLLDDTTLRKYIEICNQIGISALVEAHSETEIQSALRSGARLIGINNRNLKDFTVDIGNAIRLRHCIPREVLCVAESGIHTADDIAMLSQAGMDAVLIGESLMLADNKQNKLKELKEKL